MQITIQYLDCLKWNIMNVKEVRQWIVTIILFFSSMPKVNLQMAMQTINMPSHMFAFPPPPPMPAPMPFPAPAPIAFQILEIKESKTTTITTEKSNGKEERTIGIAIPMGYPSPVQFAVPAYAPPAFCMKKPRPYNCPVCPPCLCNPCTPAFFSYCSPCHQKCRCRNSDDAPVPLPHKAPDPVLGPAFPVPIPMPIMASQGLIVPVHHKINWRTNSRTLRTYDNSDETSEYLSSYFTE